jgi:hypothetical protein
VKLNIGQALGNNLTVSQTTKTSGFGTFETSHDVRRLVAHGRGKPDIANAVQYGCRAVASTQAAPCYTSIGSGSPGRALTSQHPADAAISPVTASGSEKQAALESTTRFEGLVLAFVGVLGLVAGTLQTRTNKSGAASTARPV